MRSARGLILAVVLVFAAACSSAHPARPARAVRPVPAGPGPDRLYGVTVDDVSRLRLVVASLARLPARPVVRIAFDPGMQPGDYASAVGAIGKVASIMAEPVDSSEVTGYTPGQYAARFRRYIGSFGKKILIWEVGNEVNGDWLGPPAEVRTDIEGAYHAVRRAGGRTALTLVYQPGCAATGMFAWATRYIPRDMRLGLDYVLVSYYEEDCNNYRPGAAEWTRVFGRLRRIFPAAKLGFGEVGTHQNDPVAYKLATLRHYYGIDPPVPGFIGGYFWWYYAEDMIPYLRNPLWQALGTVMRDGKRISTVTPPGAGSG
jgi:hypothetical protein